MPDLIRLCLVDDHPLLREGVASTLAAEADIEVLAQGANAEDALHIAREHLPDIILLDISMPGGGINAVRSIYTACPVVKAVVLTVSESEDDVLEAFKAGARGYVLKGVSGPELIRIVRSVYNGETYITPNLAATLLLDSKARGAREESETNPLDELSQRESEILGHVAQGLSNKKIAAELFLSEKTIKHYMSNILQKLHVHNRVEAALLAQKNHKE